MAAKKCKIMKTETTALIPKLYIGIDVHKKSWTFHYQTDLFDGKTITQPANPNKLIDWVQKHFPVHEVLLLAVSATRVRLVYVSAYLSFPYIIFFTSWSLVSMSPTNIR